MWVRVGACDRLRVCEGVRARARACVGWVCGGFVCVGFVCVGCVCVGCAGCRDGW